MIRPKENSLIKFAGEGVGWRKTESYKDDMHFTWKLSDIIVTALCFDGPGRVLSDTCLISISESVSDGVQNIKSEYRYS